MAQANEIESYFYQHKFPKNDELVMVKIKSEDEDIGFICSLMEYNNKEGFLHLTRISKRRIRSVKRVWLNKIFHNNSKMVYVK